MFSAEQLLTPISGAQPSGADLSFSAELDAISLARRFDDPSLDQGEWVSELKEADWDFVIEHCSALLASTSKDLRLAVWLTEAAAKQHHLRGLGEGFRLLAGLCDQYWEQGLHPLSQDEDHDQRIGNLSWILGRTPALVRAVPLTEKQHGAYSSIDFDSARKPGPLKLADLEAARQSNSTQFNARCAADAKFCMDALLDLERAADARLGADSPGFTNARETLRGMLHAAPVALPATDMVDADSPLPLPGIPTGPLHSRAQALQQLRQVAQYFRRTEPHSPVSYFADKAADAGEQNLHDWLRGVIKDAGSLAHIEELLGVQPPAV